MQNKMAMLRKCKFAPRRKFWNDLIMEMPIIRIIYLGEVLENKILLKIWIILHVEDRGFACKYIIYGCILVWTDREGIDRSGIAV